MRPFYALDGPAATTARGWMKRIEEVYEIDSNSMCDGNATYGGCIFGNSRQLFVAL